MAASYIIRKSSDDQYYFNLTADNNEPILTSETYKEKTSAQMGINSVRQNSALAERYQRKVSGGGKNYFVLTAANGESIGKSETYSSSQAMEEGIDSVKRHGPNAPIRDLS
jgi:uncharacterized protein YegP (UPF0339 family)